MAVFLNLHLHVSKVPGLGSIAHLVDLDEENPLPLQFTVKSEPGVKSELGAPPNDNPTCSLLPATMTP